MTETEFNDLVDITYERIEDAIDNCDADIDSEDSGGVLTLSCENGSVIIFSRQAASRELWLAAKSGGFHFVYENQQWYSQKQQQALSDMLADITEQQAGERIVIDV